MIIDTSLVDSSTDAPPTSAEQKAALGVLIRAALWPQRKEGRWPDDELSEELPYVLHNLSDKIAGKGFRPTVTEGQLFASTMLRLLHFSVPDDLLWIEIIEGQLKELANYEPSQPSWQLPCAFAAEILHAARKPHPEDPAYQSTLSNGWDELLCLIAKIKENTVPEDHAA